MLSWLTNLVNLLGNWMQNPWLFLGGIGLLAAPIIIHLLNKRKFRIVEWAAIEFLLEADKQNRRRIRLENWLLLLLRCLAVLLIALLLARPFRPQSVAGGTLQSVRFERIIVLDDSLSMQAIHQGRNPFDTATRAVAQLVQSLRSVEGDETLTLIRMSKPELPALSGVQLNEGTVDDIVRDIRSLEPSDIPVRLESALLEVERLMRSETEFVNRVVYIVSDLRNRDWSFVDSGQPNSAHETLRRVSKKAVGCFIVDAGLQESVDNISITDLSTKEKVIVAGVSAVFDATVMNHGAREVRDVSVSLTAGESIPMSGKIDRIAPFSSATTSFTFTFASSEANVVEPGLGSTSVAVKATVVMNEQLDEPMKAASNKSASPDSLPDDNQRIMVARVQPGIRTLIVDGDPSAVYGKAESFSLSRSLAPPGDQRSGVVSNVVTDNELDAVSLHKYHVVYLCNLYRLTDQRRVALEAWVRSGGGLIIFPGDQIDEHVYNDSLYRDGDSLLPARLSTVLGDESEEKWCNFEVNTAGHPALSVLEGDNNPFTAWVKVFRWWNVTLDASSQASGQVFVSARFNDPLNSPAVVEKKLGEGRVVFIATSVDRDWNNWPMDPSYVIFAQELTRYMVNKSDYQNALMVGQSIKHPIDLSEYKMDVSLRSPKNYVVQLDPKQAQATGANNDQTQWMIDHQGTDVRGVYELDLKRINGQSERVLFAANVDPTEGDLTRVDMVELKQALHDAPIEIVHADKLTGVTAMGAEAELWPLILCLAVVALCTEQTLAWYFGRKR